MPEIDIKFKGYKCTSCGSSLSKHSKKIAQMICLKCKSISPNKPKRKKK